MTALTDPTDDLPEPDIIETEVPPRLVKIDESDGIHINTTFSSDRRVRKVVYDKILSAKQHLPDDITFMIYEVYRPRAHQFELWLQINQQMKSDYPDMNEHDLLKACENFVSNPYKVGSGHQFGCAVDITLCRMKDRVELDMGTAMQEFCARTATDTDGLSRDQIENRTLLKEALEREGLVNYPSEWWHYSFGDRKWAQLTGSSETLYGVLPF